MLFFVMDAIGFACRYSFITNKLDYCGKTGAFTELLDYIQAPKKEKQEKVCELLSSFFGLHSYLQLIAESNKKNWLDFDVLEAYWLGNNLLENIRHREFQRTILSLQNFGLPRDIAEKKAVFLPRNLLPQHSAHVLHVNFITQKLAPIEKNLSNCLIQWAQVQGQKFDGRIIAKGIELFSQNNEFVLREKNKLLQNPFSLQAEKRDFVSVHWNNAIALLEEHQLENLKKFTLQNIHAVNSAKTIP